MSVIEQKKAELISELIEQKQAAESLNVHLTEQLEQAKKEAFAVGEQLTAVTKWNNELAAKIEAAKPLLEKWCKECGEAEFENTCQNDCVVYELKALLFPRKEDSGTLEEHLANLRKQSPAKCQDCECLHVENHGPDHAGYVYVCETSPKCYKENTTL